MTRPTKDGPTRPLVSGGSLSGDGGTLFGGAIGSGLVPTSSGSNTWAWASNVARITSNGSNALLGPFVNFASGTGTTFSVASNTLTISSSGAGVTGFETWDEGGQPEVDDHGTAGATETIDATDGNHHRLTLDQNCTVTVLPFPDGSIVVAAYQDGTGGWDITWSGVTFADDDQPDQTASSLTFFVLISEDGTVYGFKAGGGSSVASLDDLSDVTITAPAEDDDLRYNGSVWVNDARKWEAVTDGEDVFVWESDDLVHEWNA